MTAPLQPGDPAPWFRAPVIGANPAFSFDTVGGRVVLMLFAGSTSAPGVAAALAMLQAQRDIFDDERACFFGVTSDPADFESGLARLDLPGVRWFFDADRAVARAYGAVTAETVPRPHWLLLDAMLRVVGRAGLADSAAILALARRLAAISMDHVPAPVLAVPNVLDPAMCRTLIAMFEARGGEDSGVMVERDGVTVGKLDHGFKRRADCMIDDPALQRQLRQRVERTLVPMINRAFQFQPTRIERWLIACYDEADGGGHFKAHRDNTTAGTAHRRFACTINLNAEDYDGGDLVFPEYGRRRYRAATGGAIVFSCSLLHMVVPVTRGRRYAFLPFFYDEAAAMLREANMGRVAPEISGYRAQPQPGASPPVATAETGVALPRGGEHG